ncbi:MAG TPA: tetratricopeptide repeat protein [Symbiobacteriaceae bacterium]|nr:tetratricopeptide repeat protein [Symbiobacteriaceae bacterium]
MVAIRTHNLPVQATSLIGREREIAEIGLLLGGTRLLTLTGAGGTGKTRLALEAASHLLPGYPDGVWLVELAGLSDPGQVARTVALALGLRDDGHSVPAAQLAEFLEEKRLLLVLDNCEHLVGACAALADFLLQECPGLTVLATSREPLAIPWETSWPVPTLVPENEGVRLFTTRALAVRPDFQVTPAVVEICRRLDGMPLAIELAAARVRALAPEQIAERLDDSLKLLTGGSRTSAPRQQTLKSAIDWSYDLLSEPERALFRRLAVFGGGFTLEAAEAVWGEEPAEVLDLLTQLVEKSLVVSVQAPRYRVLEPLRQYGLALLMECGEEQAARDRHLAYFMAMAGQSDHALSGHQQGAWLKRLDQEHDNIRLALTWALEHNPEAGCWIAGCMERYWSLRGHMSEGSCWLEMLLERAPAPTLARARALATAGMLRVENAESLLEESHRLYEALDDKRGAAWSGLSLATRYHQTWDEEKADALVAKCKALFAELGEKAGLAYLLPLESRRESRSPARQKALLEERLQLLREAGDKASMVQTLRDLANLHHFWRETASASRRIDEALQLAEAIGDQVGMVGATLARGDIAHREGQPDQARHLYEQALAQARAMGDRVLVTDAQFMLGRLALARGDGEEARDRLTEVLRVTRLIKATHFERITQTMLGHAYLLLREYDRARTEVEQGLAAARAQGADGAVAWGLRLLGIIAGAQGHCDEALRLQRESLRIETRDPSQKPGLALGLCMTGVWLVHLGQAAQGLRLIAAADAVHPLATALDPLERPYLQPALDTARSALGSDGYERAWAGGAALPLETALAEALREKAPDLPAGLTAREAEVVRLVAEGLSDREVGARLFISPRTVDTHLRNIFTKTGVDSRTALAAWAMRAGLLSR